ncbi:MAG: Coq4 family protein [Hyphomonadaceae bacterium]|nr:Coq4 family protein [Hyphomonadaceae bacterium]
MADQSGPGPDMFSRFGVADLSTPSSALISSSKYLNNPMLREAMATALLRRNGRDRRVGWDSQHIVRAYWEVRDTGRINAMLKEARVADAKLDAWFEERHISTFRRDDLKKYPPDSLGGVFHAYLVSQNLDIDLDPNLRRDPNWRPDTDLQYWELRSAQTHDFEHLLAGVGFDYLGEMAPFWMRIENYFAHLDAELAGELAAVHLLLVLPMFTRTMLHYPRAWTALTEYTRHATELGRRSGPLYMAKYEDLFELTLPQARLKLGMGEVPEYDTMALSDYWSEGAQSNPEIKAM